MVQGLMKSGDDVRSFVKDLERRHATIGNKLPYRWHNTGSQAEGIEELASLGYVLQGGRIRTIGETFHPDVGDEYVGNCMAQLESNSLASFA